MVGDQLITEDVYKRQVPLIADSNWGHNWYDAK